MLWRATLETTPIVDNEKVDGMENWLIIAKQGSSLIREWRKAFVNYWETRKRGQWISEHEMYKDPGFTFGGLGISAANYLNQHAAFKYVLHYQPLLAQEIYPIKNLNPWWLHGRVGGDANSLYKGIISKDINIWAQEIKSEGVGLLKFAGGHLTEIRAHFTTVESYCLVPNLITLIYGHCP